MKKLSECERATLIACLREALVYQEKWTHRVGMCTAIGSTTAPYWARTYLLDWIDSMLAGGATASLEWWVNEHCDTNFLFPCLPRRPWVEWMINELKNGK